jgi:hypothetical protein
MEFIIQIYRPPAFFHLLQHFLEKHVVTDKQEALERICYKWSVWTMLNYVVKHEFFSNSTFLLWHVPNYTSNTMLKVLNCFKN